MSKKNLTAISLFSGAGGFDIGISNSGFDVLCAIEIDEHCCATLGHNLRQTGAETKVIHDDINNVSPAKLKSTSGLRKGQLDLLFGGPPCQSFSAIGKRKGLEDERGILIFQMVRFAEIFKPKFILMEQVLGFRTATGPEGDRGGVQELLNKRLGDLGYTVKIQVLNAAEFGVPQLRKRMFVSAWKNKHVFEFPHPTHSKNNDYFSINRFVTVGESLLDLGMPYPKGTEDKFSHIDVTPDGDRKKISFVNEGGNLVNSDAPKDIKGTLTKKDTTKFLRLNRESQSNTLRCGEIFYHPVEDRYLTPREYMRIHTFPDTYELKGPIRGRSGQVKNLDQHRQVANSVPPKLAEAIGVQIRSFLTDR